MRPKYCFFPPDREPVNTDQGKEEYCREGTYAYERGCARWYVWTEDHSTDKFFADWRVIPAALVPAEHRAYILIHP